MLAADPPAAVATAPVDKPADVVVVSRDTRSEVIASKDTPLPLLRAGKTEDALLRQAIFLTSALTVVRPTAGADEKVLRWTHQSYLQRQFCVTSITGQFSCTLPEVEELPEKASGEAPVAATPDQATSDPAETARVAIATTLRTRADAQFEDDRRLKLDPMLKTAAVSIRRPTASAGRR